MYKSYKAELSLFTLISITRVHRHNLLGLDSGHEFLLCTLELFMKSKMRLCSMCFVTLDTVMVTQARV